MMTELTDEVLAELERLHAESPTNWVCSLDCLGDDLLSVCVNNPKVDFLADMQTDIEIKTQTDWRKGKQTTEWKVGQLMVAMYNHLPALTDAARRVRSLEAELEQQLAAEREKVERLREVIDGISHNDASRKLMLGQSWKIICCNYIDQVLAAKGYTVALEWNREKAE